LRFGDIGGERVGESQLRQVGRLRKRFVLVCVTVRKEVRIYIKGGTGTSGSLTTKESARTGTPGLPITDRK